MQKVERSEAGTYVLQSCESVCRCIVHGCRVAFQGGRWDRNRYMEDRKLGEGRGEEAGLLQGRSIKDARVKRVPFNF